MASNTDRLGALVDQMRQRDERALAQLYDLLAARAYGLALRISGRPQLAEEIVEDTFFQMWREAERFDPARGQVQAWMMTICRSRALDALRKRDKAESDGDNDACLEQLASDELQPDRALEQFDQGSSVRSALERLPSRERQAVALAFFKGLSHQEIADQWQMPIGSVKTLIRRAIGQLRADMAVSFETPGMT